ncbi:nucleotidyltransferase family protein [Roseateles chitosanitabidus]|uniref:nucleotidyltransferase family protein n=1 Tax=Roseateles chitosanitabidus TaxID=65048 RepID=UPI0008314CD1|nr:nucleotidyltransferase family protein [Roseateles chitosanitabidus]MBO9685135.1 nucleotidyltransferase family protein [Roseateles chitosanitabidus]
MPLRERFLADLLTNRHNRTILDRWDRLALPDGWLVAGCLFQSVWNLRMGRAPESDIKDYDLFYFDGQDLTRETEQRVQARVDEVLGDLGIQIEAINQARVHLWYEEDFGHPYEALTCSRDGIERFLVPSTCVGVRPGEIYAPYGLESLYAGTLAMNPLTPHRDLFEAKAASYQRRWPWLTIVSPE